MLHVESIHTVVIVDEIQHFMSYFTALYGNGLHAHRLRTYLKSNCARGEWRLLNKFIGQKRTIKVDDHDNDEYYM